MTTYQDPPPQSRRAARQYERAQTAARDPRDDAQRDAAQWEQQDPNQNPNGVRPSGRRAQPPSAGEPLNYVTQSRSDVTEFGVGSHRGSAFSRTEAEPRYQEPDVPTQALPAQDRPAYRVRDYSPEGRRAAPRPAPPEYGTNLDYRTQAGPLQPAPAQAPPPPAVAPPGFEQAVAAASVPPPQHTLTRRQLRALREAEEARDAAAEAAAQVDAIDHLIRSGPIDLPHLAGQQPVQPGWNAAAEPQAPVPPGAGMSASTNQQWVHAEPTPAGPVPVAQQPTQPPQAHPAQPYPGEPYPAQSQAAQQPAQWETAQAQPAQSQPAPSGEYPSFTDLIGIRPSGSAQQPPAPTGYTGQFDTGEVGHAGQASHTGQVDYPAGQAGQTGPTGVESLFRAADATPAPLIEPEPEQARPASRVLPFGHWSTQSELDDQTQPAGSTGGFAENVSTTSALVMPSSPTPSDLSYSLGTGEILVTGSIDLPRSLGSTGADENTLDGPAIDDLLDPGDSEVTDSAPVRAVRAVSSHTSTRGVIASRKPKGTKLATVLLIAASAMAVVVVTLFVVSVLTGNL